MPRKAESRIVERIMRALRSRGHWVVKVHGDAFQENGVPDLVACMRPSGRFVAIECKTALGSETALQQYQGALIVKAGGMYIVARSLDDLPTSVFGQLE